MGEYIEGIPYSLLGKQYQMYPEKYAIKNLLLESKEFLYFYENQRDKIGEIVWLADDGLSANMRNMIGENEAFILTKGFPICLSDSFDTAHEIQHIICGYEGYPCTQFTEKGFQKNIDFKYITIIANSLNDPVVNGKLIPYKFDLLDYYNKASRIQRRWRQDSDFSYIDNLGMSFEVCLYVQKYYDWQTIKEITHETNNKFLEWYDYRFPNVATTARNIINYINHKGFETPEKCVEILKYIVSYFSLDDIIQVCTVKDL